MQAHAIDYTEKTYKVRARGMSRIPDTSCCRMEISVGQAYHEGAKLKAALDWAERFPRVVLIIGDLPQRYNYMAADGIGEAEATRRALSEGDAWLARNAGLLKQHGRFEVRRWAAFKYTSDYIQARWQVNNLYQENSAFKDAIDSACKNEFSLDYLLEESAIFAVAYGELKGFSAYPGSFLDTWNMFLEDDVPGAPEGFKHAYHVTLGFDPR